MISSEEERRKQNEMFSGKEDKRHRKGFAIEAQGKRRIFFC